ncbi:MAG: 13E12 repeat family protein [Actinomycetota bacterium]|nr:13E12 repeat family protein [Actinomycetota bacterium]
MFPLTETVPGAVSGPASLSPAGLIDTMAELHRAESVLVERKLAVIAALAEHRLCEAARDEIDCGAEVAEAEVGAALTVGRGEAGRLIDLGTVLAHRLPRVRAAMAAGKLDAYRAGLIASSTRTVADEHIAVVERLALEKLLAPAGADGVGLTGQRARNAIAAIIGRIDPAGVRERRRRSATERFVGVSAVEDAMVHLFGSLPAADGRKLDARLRELANTPCPADGRTFEQRKADAVGALVDGLDSLPCACGREDCPQHSGNVPTPRKPLIHVILLGSTLEGVDDETAYLDGYGLIDAEHARTLADDADIEYVHVPDDVHYDRAQAAAEYTGTAAEANSTGSSDPGLPASAYVYRPNAMLDAWIRILCGTCQWPHCDVPAWNADLDHDEPFDHRNPSRGGKTTAAGMKAYCRTHHRIKHSGTWNERHNPDRSIDYVSPTRHRYHCPATGYLDLLGIHPGDITDLGPRARRRRRTHAENKAASIRAERRRQRTRIDLKKIRHTRIHTGEPLEDDEPCPF